MKVELAVPSPPHGHDEMRESRGQAATSSGWGSQRGGSELVSSGGGNTGRLCDSLGVIPERLGNFDDVASEKVEEDSNVKVELGA